MLSVDDFLQCGDETERWLYREMVRYVRFMVGMYAIQGHWAMNPDDLLGECFLALARCWRMYSPRLVSDLTRDQMLAIAKMSVKNAIRTLLYHCFKASGRAVEYNGVSLDDDDAGLEIDAGGDPAVLYDSVERMVALLRNLSDFELKVLDCLLGGNERVAMYLRVSSQRRSWVFKAPMVTITPLIVARALCVPVEEIERAYTMISSKMVAQEELVDERVG